MKTVYVLARTLSTATRALHTALEDHSSIDEHLIAFRFIATAEQVRSLPKGQSFVVVQGWKGRPDSKEVLAALRDCAWQPTSMKELFLG